MGGIGTFTLILMGLAAVMVSLAVKIVPQSQKLIIERLGRFQAVLESGPHIIVPILDRVAHRIDILERQLEEYPIDVITKDNVQFRVSVSTFFRVLRPEYTVYRIKNIDSAIQTAVMGIVRSEIGQVDFDHVQSNRDSLSERLKTQLEQMAGDWGVDITRSEILDVAVDEATREAMQLQISAERERRAAIARAEGKKKSVELEADADLYAAQRAAEGQKVTADAQAYATGTIAEAINANGAAAAEFQIRKERIAAMTDLAASDGSRLILLPNDGNEAFSGLAGFGSVLSETLGSAGGSGANAGAGTAPAAQ